MRPLPVRIFIYSMSLLVAALFGNIASLTMSGWSSASALTAMTAVALCAFAITTMLLEHWIPVPVVTPVPVVLSDTARRIVDWLNTLPSYDKGAGKLFREKRYCCLGVGMVTLGELPRPGQAVLDPGHDTALGLRCAAGEMTNMIFINGQCASYLTSVNDRIFNEDADFTRMRIFMLISTDLWIKDQGVAQEVREHFKKEIAQHKRCRISDVAFHIP